MERAAISAAAPLWSPAGRREKLMTIGVRPREQLGLEIGAAFNPIIPPTAGTCRYIDYMSTDDLKKRLAKHGRNDKIVNVDYVWAGTGSLTELLDGVRFDYALASHVLEHVPNAIGWFAGVYEALKPGAYLNLALPDRRFTFDFACPDSSVGDLVEAYLMGYTRPSPRQVFDSCFYGKAINPGMRWREDIDPNAVPAYTGDNASALSLAQAKRSIDGEYFDSHCWVFTPATFLKLMRGICTLGLMPFEFFDYHPTIAGAFEFFVSLRRPENELKPEVLRQRQLAKLDFFERAIANTAREAQLLTEA